MPEPRSHCVNAPDTRKQRFLTRVRTGKSGLAWRLIAAWIVLVCAWFQVSQARAATPLQVEEVEVDLTIHPGGMQMPDGIRVRRNNAFVDGIAVYRLNRPAREGERLVLLNAAEVLQRDSPELGEVDEVVLETHLDGPFQAGSLELAQLGGAKSVKRTGRRRDVTVEVLPGARIFRLHYRVKVPRRYWPFGCARRRCHLAGAIAPLPSEPARGGAYSDPGSRVIQPVAWHVRRVRFAGAPQWEPGTDPPADVPAGLAKLEVVVADTPPTGAGAQAYPSVFWGPKWRRATELYRGVEIEVLHTLWRPGDQMPAERKLQLYRDVPGHLLRAAREVIDVAAARGESLAPGSHVVLVQGPLRAQIAAFHPSSVTVSDQMLQLFPGKRFMGFHRAAVARALFDSIAYGAFAGRHDASTDLWLAGAVAMDWLDLWSFRVQKSDEYARDILGKFAFVPAVDNFLYTGQAAFSQAYFRGSEDEMPLRRHPLMFSHDLPTGRRIHEKLRDLLGPQRLAAFHQQMLTDRDADPQQLASEVYGHRLEWFFAQWLGPYPAVDYVLGGVESRRIENKFTHKIKILKNTSQPIVEPVQVLAVEMSGEAHYLLWNGDDASAPKKLADVPLHSEHSWSLETDTRLKFVHVDPRRRAFETPIDPDNVDPLFNNRDPSGARFLYTGFGLNVAATEFLTAQTASARLSALSFYAFFEASRRRDLRATGHFQLYSDRSTLFGFGTGGNFWFGPKINRQRRRSRVRIFADFGILDAGGLDPKGGIRLGQSLAWVHDSRQFSRWPDRGRRLAVSLGSTEVLRTEGSTDHRYALNATATWVELWPLAHQHVLASQLEGSMVIPLASELEYRSLPKAGGIGELSGYGGNELLSRAYVMAQLEYRHVFFNNLDINVIHLAWLRSIGGALSTGVATLSRCEDYGGLFASNSFYGQVGYGLTGHLRLLGVTPQFIRLDVSVPLVRRVTNCLGHTFPDYLAEKQGLDDPAPLLSPVSVNLTFVQPF